MRYLIIEKLDAEKLSEAVNEHLEEGWELYGAPMMAAYETEAGDQTIYAQALTSEEEPIHKEIAQHLSTLLNVPEDQLDSLSEVKRAELAEILQKALGDAVIESKD